MCGISGIFGQNWNPSQLKGMVARQAHRGPDDSGIFIGSTFGLGHNRLSIIDLSPSGHQPMFNYDNSLAIVFNGEIYNYVELRTELSEYPYRSQSDTEVILAAYERWGEACLDHFIGMFAFLLWDGRLNRLFAARDRFGVKPLYYHQQANGTLFAASEIKALHIAGIEPKYNVSMWANYLVLGMYSQGENTFWRDINTLPAGHKLIWQAGHLKITQWYDLAVAIGNRRETRRTEDVEAEYLSLMEENVRLRFRADVSVGINLSGGLDSSLLLNTVQRVQGEGSDVKAFTFITGDPNYDELPWVIQMLERAQHPLVVCSLAAEDVPALAQSVQAYQDEPFGGIPTLAYARVFEQARAHGVVVLLDGQGMDEQWAGYDYYQDVLDNERNEYSQRLIQGMRDKPVKPDCLNPEFRAQANSLMLEQPFKEKLLNLQYRDIRYTKLPRALRFNDRVSMRSSTELREPFLDHRLFELALIQPLERKLVRGEGKIMLRQLARHLLSRGVVEAPKRALQTPQREWLRTSLREWADSMIKSALHSTSGDWFNKADVYNAWQSFCNGEGDNSFYVWQWINLGLIESTMPTLLGGYIGTT